MGGRARSCAGIPGLETTEDTPLGGWFRFLWEGRGDVSIEGVFWTIMLAGRLSGDDGRVGLAADGRRGTRRNVDDFLGDAGGFSEEADERAEGPMMGDEFATAFPCALGELVWETGKGELGEEDSGTGTGGGDTG